MKSKIKPSGFLYAKEKDFNQHYEQVIWNFFYLNRNLESIFQASGRLTHSVLAYFDSDGYLIKLYGNDTSLENAKKDGIIPHAIWNKKTTGKNAVTTGLEIGISASSVGEENELEILQKYAIYFVPIQLLKGVLDNPEDNAPFRFGGIAILVPEKYQNPDYLLTAAALTHDVQMTLHFNQTANHLYEREKSGLIIIDSSMIPNQNTIIHSNDMLFKALGLPVKNIRYQPLKNFIEPDKNPQFWEIVDKKCHLTEVPITINIKNKSISCIISCDVYNQPSLNASGVIVYITTPQMESRKISKKMGNAAILSFSNIIGESDALKSAIHRASLIANTDSNVMILGESGVGKDVFAQAIHNASSRKNKPFIAVNCGALPRELISSELFGYDSGAFTGAKKGGNIGKFELANGGTIFLDEIGELPIDLQATLLRVVEQKKLMRLGSNKVIDIDVKIISATNADLPSMIQKKLFRSDLFFRLSTLKLFIPPLRERERDVILLSDYFIRSISQRIGRNDIMVLSDEASNLLMKQPWSGNVRELQNLIESIVQLYPGQIILPEYIQDNLVDFRSSYTPVFDNNESDFLSDSSEKLSSSEVYVPEKTEIRKRKTFSKKEIQEALKICGGNRSKAADYLGISRRTFYRHMEKLGLTNID